MAIAELLPGSPPNTAPGQERSIRMSLERAEVFVESCRLDMCPPHGTVEKVNPRSVTLIGYVRVASLHGSNILPSCPGFSLGRRFAPLL